MRKVTLMEMLKEPFKKPSPLEVIATELADAHLSKLEAETACEYAQSIVDYNVVRITRLNSRMDEYRNDIEVTRIGGTK
jgi:hypothetical protein